MEFFESSFVWAVYIGKNVSYLLLHSNNLDIKRFTYRGALCVENRVERNRLFLFDHHLSFGGLVVQETHNYG